MRVVALKTLRDFWVRHADAEQPLRAWHDQVSKAIWRQPADIKAQFGNASILKNRRVVFNIKGNDYRLVVAFAFNLETAVDRFPPLDTPHEHEHSSPRHASPRR